MDAIHCSKYNITISILIETLVMPRIWEGLYEMINLYIFNNHTYISYIFVGTLAMPGDMGKTGKIGAQRIPR